MKSKILSSVLVFGLIISAFSQQSTLELTFTATNNSEQVLLDSILIENLSKGVDTTLYAPNTVFMYDFTTLGIPTLSKDTSVVSQNYPNPFAGYTSFNINLLENKNVKLTVFNVLGVELVQYDKNLERGNHTFDFYSGDEKLYILLVTSNQINKTIKMLSTGVNLGFGGKCKLSYRGHNADKASYRFQNAMNSFTLDLGDQLRYTGFAMTVNGVEGSDVIEDTLLESQAYEFEITEGVPCPGIPTVTYEGQVYNTVLIGEQCWFKENLNLGTMIPGELESHDNGVIEKYCYDDDPANCVIYGGLYSWYEVMAYSNIPGSQGLCPIGWHIPTDEEWMQLEGEVDSQYNYPDPEWEELNFRGFDVGKKLKSNYDWINNGNGTNDFGFTALPAGHRDHDASGFEFYSMGEIAFFWSSTEYFAAYAKERNLWGSYSGADKSYRGSEVKGLGYCVRCVKD